VHPGQPLSGVGGDPHRDGGFPTYSGYAGPPPTAAHDPGTPPLPTYPYPTGYPNPDLGRYQAGYGYPGADSIARRPGTTTAAAVLGYVSGGLLVIAAMVVFTGASLVSGIDAAAVGVDLDRITAELSFDGFVNLLAAGLFIAGAVVMSMRRTSGRAMYSVAAVIVVIESVYWVSRWGPLVQDAGGMAFYALLYGALAVVGTALAWTRDGTAWLTAQRSAPPWHGPPPYGPPNGPVPPVRPW
jgi:hypothetical protein